MFISPDLSARGDKLALGAALKLLVDCIKSEVKQCTYEQKCDWKPLVLLLIDGTPTDDWESAADQVNQNVSCNIICVACGEGAEPDQLKRVSDTVLVMKDMSPDAFVPFFKWVSQSRKQEAQ